MTVLLSSPVFIFSSPQKILLKVIIKNNSLPWALAFFSNFNHTSKWPSCSLNHSDLPSHTWRKDFSQMHSILIYCIHCFALIICNLHLVIHVDFVSCVDSLWSISHDSVTPMSQGSLSRNILFDIELLILSYFHGLFTLLMLSYGSVTQFIKVVLNIDSHYLNFMHR